MRPQGVEIGNPVVEQLTGVVEINEQPLIEKFITHPAVEGLNVAVLHRSSRCDVVPFHCVTFAQLGWR